MLLQEKACKDSHLFCAGRTNSPGLTLLSWKQLGKHVLSEMATLVAAFAKAEEAFWKWTGKKTYCVSWLLQSSSIEGTFIWRNAWKPCTDCYRLVHEPGKRFPCRENLNIRNSFKWGAWESLPGKACIREDVFIGVLGFLLVSWGTLFASLLLSSV